MASPFSIFKCNWCGTFFTIMSPLNRTNPEYVAVLEHIKEHGECE